MSDDRKTTTVRLRRTLALQLDRASFLLQRSQSSIIEEALETFLKNNPRLARRYQLNVMADQVALLEVVADEAHIRDIKKRNGVPVEEIAEEYSNKFQLETPIQIIEEK